MNWDEIDISKLDPTELRHYLELLAEDVVLAGSDPLGSARDKMLTDSIENLKAQLAALEK